MGQMDIYAASILIVDDNPVNIAVVEAILSKDGYSHVQSTTNPLEVIRRYREYQYDLILLDVHMPELSGIELMQRMVDAFPDDYLPIIVLTADYTTETRTQCLSGGAKDFIGKPFDKVEVLLRVRNILSVCMLNKAAQRQNIVLEERVRERTRQLNEAQIKLIQCLGKAAEYRDNETGMHVVRMSKSCERLARQMGLSEAECELILQASPMHDIGKIAIPDKVLLKKGRFDKSEWQIMKTHTEAGAEILGGYDSQLMQVASQIALTHHEKWDGSGYPKGLQGEEIPLYSRIVAVCDVFDALTSSRPYKKAWSVKAALEYLREQSGQHFEPKVVDAFIQIVDEVVLLQAEFVDEPVEVDSRREGNLPVQW
jgi:putative two-component system response regulator